MKAVLVCFALLLACVYADNEARYYEAENCNQIVGKWSFQATIVAAWDAETDNGDSDRNGGAVGSLEFKYGCKKVAMDGLYMPLYGADANFHHTWNDADIVWSDGGRRFSFGEQFSRINCQIVSQQSLIWCVSSGLNGSFSVSDVYTWELVRGS